MGKMISIEIGTYIGVLTDYHSNGSYESLKKNVYLSDKKDYAIMIRTLNFERDDFLNELIYIDKHAYEHLEKSKVLPDDILMNKIANPGSVYLMPDLNYPVSCGMNLFLIRFNSQVNQRYMYYCMKNSETYIKSLGHGTTTKTITKDDVKGIHLLIHQDLAIQEKISNVLSTLEKKIELNKLIIAKMEQIAQTIYNYWFIQFDFPNDEGKPYRFSGGKMIWNERLKKEIPKGWSVSLLSELGEFKNGINYDKDSNKERTVKIINVRDISSSSSVLLQDTLDDISLPEQEIQKYLVGENDILIARSGIPGATRFMSQDTVDTIYCGFIIRYRVENEKMKIYLYLRLKEMEQVSFSQSGGTILKNISQDILKDIITIKPDDFVLTKFYHEVKPIFKMLFSKSKENQELEKLRDWLLPMLMNGQITVD